MSHVYTLGEQFEVPPFFSVNVRNEAYSIQPGFVRVEVVLIPARCLEDYFADVNKSEFLSLREDLRIADRHALEIVAARNTEYDRLKKKPIVGGWLARLNEDATMPNYYDAEHASWKASREILMLLNRCAVDQEKTKSKRHLEHYYSGIGSWASTQGPSRSSG